jgi:hypothetical protein
MGVCRLWLVPCGQLLRLQGPGHNPHTPITQNTTWVAYKALTTPWGWQSYAETCRGRIWKVLIIKHPLLPTAFVGLFTYKTSQSCLTCGSELSFEERDRNRGKFGHSSCQHSSAQQTNQLLWIVKPPVFKSEIIKQFSPNRRNSNRVPRHDRTFNPYWSNVALNSTAFSVLPSPNSKSNWELAWQCFMLVYIKFPILNGCLKTSKTLDFLEN